VPLARARRRCLLALPLALGRRPLQQLPLGQLLLQPREGCPGEVDLALQGRVRGLQLMHLVPQGLGLPPRPLELLPEFVPGLSEPAVLLLGMLELELKLPPARATGQMLLVGGTQMVSQFCRQLLVVCLGLGQLELEAQDCLLEVCGLCLRLGVEGEHLLDLVLECGQAGLLVPEFGYLLEHSLSLAGRGCQCCLGLEVTHNFIETIRSGCRGGRWCCTSAR
jgi:hypothetical protein